MTESACETTAWKENRVRRRRIMDGDIAEDELAGNAKDEWKRETFHVAMDMAMNWMTNRFEEHRPLLQSPAFFAPNGFPDHIKNVVSTHDPDFKLRSFCTMFHIDSNRCADELLSFAQNFKKFNRSLFLDGNEDEEERDSDLDSLINSSSESEDHNDDSDVNGDDIRGGVPDEKDKS